MLQLWERRSEERRRFSRETNQNSLTGRTAKTVTN